MKNVACWDAQDAFSIINPDADALEDYVFRAVHTDFAVRVRSGGGGAVRLLTPKELLEEILYPQDHAIVPVIGQSGTGKSHLIRWLDLQLRASSDVREVIYVPKAQTNLRDIVYSLVRRLPESEQSSYLEALSQTGNAHLTPEAQRTAILNQLHVALVNDPGGSDRGIDPELERFALDGLRAVLLDPLIRKSLLVDSGFAAEIAAHVFQKPERYQPAEERREFRERDLPLQVGHLQRAAVETQEFLAWLMGTTQADRLTVVGIINRHLDWAIGNCLNLTGDRLIALMLELRRHYREAGRELVLLIEDFARLQGLDRALLQSIIEQRPDLCVLRTVFASTVGFYESIRETVRTRISFLVDMDVPAEEDGAELYGFVARYMNAVRWGADALRDQWGDVERGKVDFNVPSKCRECEHQPVCHSAFESVDGIGLYPFTRRAIRVMSERADPNIRQRFNPRLFQRLVIRPVALASESLRTGSFPPNRLLADLGGRTMPASEEARLRREDPQSWQRRIALLELWGAKQEVGNLSPDLHEAFNLPLLRGVDPDTKYEQEEPLVRPDPQRVDLRFKELQEWREGRAKLKASTAQDLRDLVFAALEDFVAWDDVGIARSTLFGKSGRRGLFNARDIAFQNQATQAAAGLVRLVIPANWEDEAVRLRTALALEGLLEVKAKGDWAIPNGLEKLACLTECLREWSETVVDQAKAWESSNSGWDAASVAFEIRAILQTLLQPNLPVVSDQDVLRAGFAAPAEGRPDFIIQELNELVRDMQDVDAVMHEIVRARYSATKGGQAGEFIDSARLMPIVRSLRRRRMLPDSTAAAIGSSARERADPIRQLAKRVGETLLVALGKEAAARDALKRRLMETFGERPSWEGIVQSTQRLVDAAAFLQISGVQHFAAARARFERVSFDELLASLRLADPEKLHTRDLRSGIGEAALAAEELMRLAATLLGNCESELAARLETAGVDPAEKARIAAAIALDLEQIGDQLVRYHDGNAN
jgi:hypothetical protein